MKNGGKSILCRNFWTASDTYGQQHENLSKRAESDGHFSMLSWFVAVLVQTLSGFRKFCCFMIKIPKMITIAAIAIWLTSLLFSRLLFKKILNMTSPPLCFTYFLGCQMGLGSSFFLERRWWSRQFWKLPFTSFCFFNEKNLAKVSFYFHL